MSFTNPGPASSRSDTLSLNISVADIPSVSFAQPANVTANAGDKIIRVTWSSSAAPLYFSITLQPSGVTIQSSGFSAIFSGLSNGTAYTAFVSAVYAGGKSVSVSSIAVTPSPIPWGNVTTGSLFARYSIDGLVAAPTNGNPLVSGSGGTGIFLNDLSGNGRNVTSISSVPTMVTSWANSKPAINFNGNGNYITLPFDTTSWNGQVSLFIVGALTALNNTAVQSDQHLFSNTNYNGTAFTYDPYAVRVDMQGDGATYSSSRQVSMAQALSTTGNDNANGVTSIKAATPFVASYVFGAENGGGFQYFNGNKATGNLTIVAPTTNILILGARGNIANLNRYFNGRIAEVILYNGALSDADRHIVETSLGAKYAVTMAAQ